MKSYRASLAARPSGRSVGRRVADLGASVRRCAVRVTLVAAAAAVGLSLGPHPASAQADEFSDMRNWWTMASGDEIIASEVHPADGRVWAGTDGGGLVVWEPDGSDFQQFLFPNQPGLMSNRIYDVAFAPDGTMAWLATDYGLTVVEGLDDPPGSWRFETYVHEIWGFEDPVDGLVLLDDEQAPDTRVFSAVTVTERGTMLAGTPYSGLTVRDPDGTWQIVLSDDVTSSIDIPAEGPGTDAVSALEVVPHPSDQALDEVWVVHGRDNAGGPAVSRFLPATGEWFHVPRQGPGGDASRGPRTELVIDLAFDPATGAVWLGTWNDGVYRYDVGAAEWEHFDRDARGLCDGGGSPAIWRLDARDGLVWVACGDTNSTRPGGGAALFDGSGWITFGSGEAMPDNTISSVAISLDGETVYLGNENRPNAFTPGGEGLVAFRPGEAPAPMRTAGRTPQVNEVTAVVVDIAGRVWAGTAGAGLMRRDPDGRWGRFTRDGTGGGLPGDWITDLMIREEQLWVGTTETIYDSGANAYVDGGIGLFDLPSGEWLPPIRPTDNVERGLPDGQVSSLAAAGDGTVWIGLGAGNELSRQTFNGDGLVAFLPGDLADPDDDNWQWWDRSMVGDIAGPTVLDVATAPDQVWAATAYGPDLDGNRAGGGLALLDGAGWTQWRAEDNGFVTYYEGQVTGDVRSVTVDADGAAWAGSYIAEPGEAVSLWPLVDAVVNVLPEGARTWETATFAGQGWISTLRQDSLGRMWAGASRGVKNEYWPGEGVRDDRTSDPKSVDYGSMGAAVFLDGGVESLALQPVEHGLADTQVSDIAVDPTTGHVWIAYLNGGLSEYGVGEPVQPTVTPAVSSTPRPTFTPCPGGACPSATPRPSDTPVPTATATYTPDPANPTPSDADRVVPAYPTDEDDPGGDEGEDGAGGDGDGDDEPEPPPEVPEASTLLLFAVGLAGLFWWWNHRRQALATP